MWFKDKAEETALGIVFDRFKKLDRRLEQRRTVQKRKHSNWKWTKQDLKEYETILANVIEHRVVYETLTRTWYFHGRIRHFTRSNRKSMQRVKLNDLRKEYLSNAESKTIVTECLTIFQQVICILSK